jgi:hypothetical protein
MAANDFMEHPVVWIMVVLIFAGIFASVGFIRNCRSIRDNAEYADGANRQLDGDGRG